MPASIPENATVLPSSLDASSSLSLPGFNTPATSTASTIVTATATAPARAAPGAGPSDLTANKKKTIDSLEAAQKQLSKYKSKLMDAEAAKKVQKRTVKDWEKSFRKDNGREPTFEDKHTVREIYDTYQKRVQEVDKAEKKISAFLVMSAGAGWQLN